jgi:radical SAM superfamily enzyme YgiQ (UPF0313 family)
MKKIDILLTKVPTLNFPDCDVESFNEISSDDSHTDVLRMGKSYNSAKDKALVDYYPSLALPLLSSFLKNNFRLLNDVSIYDMNLDSFQYLSKGNEIDANFLKLCLSKLFSYKFDVIGISCQFQIHQKWIDFFSDAIKKRSPSVKIITGGGFSSVFPKETIANPNIDYAVIGEGEHTLVHILNRICGINDKTFDDRYPFDGYIYRQGNKIIHKEKVQFIDKLNSTPIPDWDNYTGLREHLENNPSTPFPIMMSRGCPMQCSFCNTAQQWGLKVRYAPKDNIINELLFLYNNYNVRRVHCVDDNILIKRNWLIEFCNEAKDKLPNDLIFLFSNFDLRFINDDIIKCLKNINVRNITLAPETGSQKTQKLISKKLRLDVVADKVKLVQKNGLFIHLAFIIGFPGEELEDIFETIEFARKLRVESVQIHALALYKGTRVYEDALALGVIDFDSIKDYSDRGWHKSHIKSNEWTSNQLTQLAYDTGIELNFLATTLWETEFGIKVLIYKMERFTRLISNHTIAEIVLGYLYNVTGERTKMIIHYNNAINSLINDSSFYKYLFWEFYPVLHFNKWLECENKEMFDKIFDLDYESYRKDGLNIRSIHDYDFLNKQYRESLRIFDSYEDRDVGSYAKV